MKKMFIMYAKYLQDKDKKITSILEKLSNEQREKDAGSYYKSIKGIYEHCAGCTALFITLLQSALPAGSHGLSVKGGDANTVKDLSWDKLKEFSAKADDSFLDFVTKLTDDDFAREIKWFSGDMVTVSYALNCLLVHQTHHQGQLSQILDELKIDNDFSSIPPKFMDTSKH
ncbi:MAG: hypothetical protein Ta2B_25530 [Termitinemataceae bacterium]|nr:MAG: hypothetical protein Ta2B_25530 [Termitinemataceae bacterium]